MKNLRLISFLCAFTLVQFITLAQSDSSKYTSSRHEIGIVMDDIFERSTTYIGTYPFSRSPYISPPISSTRMGVAYKFHFPKSAIRSKVSFNSSNNQSENNGLDFKSGGFSAMLFLGYEFNKTLNRTQLFYGMDLQLSNSRAKTEYSGGGFNAATYKTTEKGIGISPLIGVRYFISPMFSLSTELKFVVEKYVNKSSNTIIFKNQLNTTNPTDENINRGLRTQFGPKGTLSLNVHF